MEWSFCSSPLGLSVSVCVFPGLFRCFIPTPLLLTTTMNSLEWSGRRHGVFDDRAGPVG